MDCVLSYSTNKRRRMDFYRATSLACFHVVFIYFVSFIINIYLFIYLGGSGGRIEPLDVFQV